MLVYKEVVASDLDKRRDILMMRLVGVKSDKYHCYFESKISCSYEHLTVGILIDTAYTVNDRLYKLHTKMAARSSLCLVYKNMIM